MICRTPIHLQSVSGVRAVWVNEDGTFLVELVTVMAICRVEQGSCSLARGLRACFLRIGSSDP